MGYEVDELRNIARLLEDLPRVFLNEMEKRNIVKKMHETELRISKCLEYFKLNKDSEITEITEITEIPEHKGKMQILADNPEEQYIADQLEALLNNKIME